MRLAGGWASRQGAAGQPVDYVGITRHGDATTNYQILPGDRVYVTQGG